MRHIHIIALIRLLFSSFFFLDQVVGFFSEPCSLNVPHRWNVIKLHWHPPLLGFRLGTDL